jgi:23S rRNA (adenine2030-N6)-methyltransferase
MNYRHAYHVGNVGDVIKHVVLTAAFERLNQKPAAYHYLDTHAGRGHYPLAAVETQRGGEFRQGILRLLERPEPPPAVALYLRLVRELGMEQNRLVNYPGSPRLALALMRAQDRAAFCELEPREAAALRQSVRGDARAAVHERDGYEALMALLPPREKRGLVMIDPPFEQPGEFERLAMALRDAHARWSSGVYLAWYPIKQGGEARRFIDRMVASGIRRQWVFELTVAPDDSPGGLNGAGMLVINPPWQIDALITTAAPWLHATLSEHGHGRWRADWIVPE